MSSRWSLGDTIGPYRIEEFLGEGGFGVVFKAFDEELKRHVAIKALKQEFLSDPGAVARFRRGAKALARTNHPYVVQIFKTFETDDGIFVVMELMECSTLKEVIRRGLPSLSQALLYAENIGLAVAHAHSKGVVHRDLKPQNIMVLPEGRVKVFDFGIALMTGSHYQTSTADRLVIGTPEYMSPEQCGGEKVDHRTDVYALGAVLFELTVGRPPFVSPEGDSDAVRYMHRHEPVPSPRKFNRRIPVDVEAIILKALSKDRANRYASAKAMVSDLRRARLAPGSAHRFRPVARTHPALVPVALLVLLGVGLTGTLAFLALPPRSPSPPELTPGLSRKASTSSSFSVVLWPTDALGDAPVVSPTARPTWREVGRGIKMRPSPSPVPRLAFVPSPEPIVPPTIVPSPVSLPPAPTASATARPTVPATASRSEQGRRRFAMGITAANRGALPEAKRHFEEARKTFEQETVQNDEAWIPLRASENAAILCDRASNRDISSAAFRASLEVLRAEVFSEAEAE